MTARALWLALGIAGIVLSVTWVPWKVHVRQRGDDIYLAWRYDAIFRETAMDAREMARFASTKLNLAISPADVEPMLDTPRVHITLAAAVFVTGFGWLLLGEWRERGSGSRPSREQDASSANQ